MANIFLNGDANSVKRVGGIHWEADRRDLSITSVNVPSDPVNQVLSFNVAGSGPIAPAFDRYQGAQLRNDANTLDVGHDGEVGYRFFIDPAWKTDGVGESSGVWAVMQNATSDIGGGGNFSIAEYVDAQAAATIAGATVSGGGAFTGGFRFWSSDVGWAKYVNTDATGFVDVTFKMGENAHSWSVKQGGTEIAAFSDTTAEIVRNSEKLTTIIVDSQNYGQNQSYIYDNISFKGTDYVNPDVAGTVSSSINRGLTPAAKNGDFLINGNGNPAVDFKVTTDTGRHLELGLSGRVAFGPVLAGTKDAAGVTHFAATTGDNIRYAYSLASTDNDQLSKYNYKLVLDIDPSTTLGAQTTTNSRAFLMRPTEDSVSLAGTKKSGYEWVLDLNQDGQITDADKVGGSLVRITDDEGNGHVTQNIQNIAWYDDAGGATTPILPIGQYDVKLLAIAKADGYNGPAFAETRVVFDVAAAPAAPAAIGASTKGSTLNPVAVGTDGFLFVGGGNSASGFATVNTTNLQLALGAKVAQGAVITGDTKSDGLVHFAFATADDKARFGYSIATFDPAPAAKFQVADADFQVAAAAAPPKLDAYDFKLKIDVDPSLAESSRTFLLRTLQTDPGKEVNRPSGYEWVLDLDNNGTITDADKVGGKLVVIADDEGNLTTHQVTQNIQNIAWYDNDTATNVLAKGSYDVRLQAFDKGGTVVKAEDHIVIDVAGGAPVGGGGGGGGGTTPTTPTTPTPTPTPTDTGSYNGNIPALVVANFFNGGTPATAAKLADLNAFAQQQFAAYKAQGVADPGLGPYEALGRGFAETAAFQTKYGAQSESAFISTNYKAVFGFDATPAQQQHFQDQIDYFEAIYVKANISESQAEILAKGAVLGQMLGVATLQGPSTHPYLLEATNFLTDVAKNVSDYGKPLSAFDII